MFSWLKRARAAQVPEQATPEQQRLAQALAVQAQQAGTLRQVALVQHLAMHWLRAPVLPVLELLLQQRVQYLARTTGSPKSTGCLPKTAPRSTSKRRRAR